MKNKIKVLNYLDMGQFPGVTLFAVGWDVDKLISWLLKKGANEWALAIEHNKDRILPTGVWGTALLARLEHKKTKEERIFPMVIIRDFDWSDFDYTSLAHEFLHICQFYLPELLDRNVEREAEAYFHSHLMTQALKHMRDVK